MKMLHRLSLGLGLAVIAGAAAEAHAKLVSAEPAVNGVAAAPPKSVALHFSEAISGKLSGATVKPASGAALPAASTTDKSGKSLMLMLKAPLKSGAYTVAWHAVASDDGHRTTGTYRFTVK
jgi:copper resistance protein C